MIVGTKCILLLQYYKQKIIGTNDFCHRNLLAQIIVGTKCISLLQALVPLII